MGFDLKLRPWTDNPQRIPQYVTVVTDQKALRACLRRVDTQEIDFNYKPPRIRGGIFQCLLFSTCSTYKTSSIKSTCDRIKFPPIAVKIC
jgi:hypothetical protein